jgi:hypothetical protein
MTICIENTVATISIVRLRGGFVVPNSAVTQITPLQIFNKEKANRRQIWCVQISTKSSGTMSIAITFCCQYRSILLLGAERKIMTATIIFGIQSRYAGNFREQ